MTMPMDISAANQPNAGSDFLSGGNAGVTVCSTGVNLGSMILPYTGSVENGGAGFQLPSRFNGGLTSDIEFTKDGLKMQSSEPTGMGVWIVGGVVALFAVMMLARKGR